MRKRFESIFRKEKKEYLLKVKDYLRENGITIMKNIYEGGLDSRKFAPNEIKYILTENFPKAPWLETYNIVEQSKCLLAHMGCLFEYDAYGRLYLEEDVIYKMIVDNHLKLSGYDILNALADWCQETNGRISYNTMQTILGPHYPRNPNTGVLDERLDIIWFLKMAGLLFRFDEEYVYFP